MPLYEYEHIEGQCALGEDRYCVLQEANEPPEATCPWCGATVKRVVSQVSIVKSYESDPAKAAKHGFTTWRKSGFGTWEKIAGPGVDMIVADEKDVQAEKEAPLPKLDLDSPEV